jgi:predicted enzyme related to lactoylglutathione lyase
VSLAHEELEIELQDWGGAPFEGRQAVWAIFAGDTDYFGPSSQHSMVNCRVDDLDAMLAQLRDAGVPVESKIEESELRRFGWATDPDGYRIELIERG